MHGDTTALLVIRAWFEEGSAQPLRAQVRVSPDLAKGFTRVATFVDPDAVRECVDEWLRSLGVSPTTGGGHDGVTPS